jgi:hypothetical protein
MTTDNDPVARNAALAARVHRLSDPLAAMGQRSPAPRLRRERNARVALLIITLSATLAITGAIATLAEPGDGTPTQAPTRNVVFQTTTDGPTHIRTASS